MGFDGFILVFDYVFCWLYFNKKYNLFKTSYLSKMFLNGYYCTTPSPDPTELSKSEIKMSRNYLICLEQDSNFKICNCRFKELFVEKDISQSS